MRKIYGLFLFGLSLASPAFAGIIYHNGTPNQSDANELTAWIQAEDFSFTSNTLVTDVHFWSLEDPSAGYSGSIYYAFYTGNTEPNLGPPSVEGFLAGTNLVRAATGNSGFGLDEFLYSFNIQPFTALANQTYWLGLHNGPLSNTSQTTFFWGATGSNSTSTGKEDADPFGDGWDDNHVEHAFYLTNDASTPTPEPATLTMIGGAVALIGLRFRRS